ncbi:MULTISPECIES: F0F1 ATP synthase subunit A [Carboxydocella]|uniref:ATP synthase subunit a n=2 Tax=Carboxydocella TaxID=178898 RepID=A0A1T4RGR3_9FIRM|nr:MULTISPECIES: F0F1 ATP synthase subunit A [Carboxydocella]AVX19544.1 ATP synthase F0 subcomplex A subunit [Carboxydocella thermautotrophica]AVX29961.1 ATP synthase F0 subcomplex A subunit [Carboxydocella thermautotrophica]SKA15099.1 ATP synthase F0 subcomplex A subunit [Carboxydocella sporoproducens DSM 16521]GAW29419.1 ATP synthase F0 subunit A [Carboxydocella sp. ULO1]GAW31405.1 ATP synthase F0 subunit A [Carboxydocella sp. JDF658]
MFGSAEALFHIGPLEVTKYTVTAWGVIALLGLISWLGTRNMQKQPSGLQNVLELFVEGLYNFFEGMLGPERVKRYFPLLCTFFLFILTSNYVGLLPLSGHEGPYIPPTATLSTTAALAIIVFFSTHIFGMMTHGIGYFKHFVQPMAFMLPLNIVEEIVRPVSLAMRLYGNIFGHELVVGTLLALAPAIVPVPMQLLGVLTGAIQAFVFTLLAASYIGGATEKHH